MALHRFEIDTSPGPASQGSLDGITRNVVMVRVRLFDGPGCVDADGREAGEEDVYTDLLPIDARRLAIRLLQHAEQAEQQSWWPGKPSTVRLSGVGDEQRR
jgi:hypothetical protein